MRHVLVEFCLAHAVFSAGRNGSARSGTRKPEPMEMPFGQRHGSVEANDREEARYVKDGLDYLLSNRGIQVVELRGVVPGEAGAVVAVIDVARLSGPLVAAAKDDGGVGLLEIVVFDFDFDAGVVREVGAV